MPRGDRQPVFGSSSGFVLVDALAALVVAAGVLAAIYSLISTASRASVAARESAFAATAVHSLCQEVSASGNLSAGLIDRSTDDVQLVAEIVQEARPRLPAETRLWRIDCTAAQTGTRLAAERTYALKGVERR